MRDESLIVKPPTPPETFVVVITVPPGVQFVVQQVPGPYETLEAGLMDSLCENKPWVYGLPANKHTRAFTFAPGTALEIMPQEAFDKLQRDARAAQAQQAAMMSMPGGLPGFPRAPRPR